MPEDRKGVLSRLLNMCSKFHSLSLWQMVD